MHLAAFPKCYMDDLCIHRTMTIFDWIEIVRDELKPIGVTGVETYHGSLLNFAPDYLATVREAHERAGLEAPMFCASPDFTSPNPTERAAEVKRQRTMMHAAASLGAKTCRVLSGQRRPEVSREQGISWVVECIESLLPYAEELGIVLVMENHFKDNYWQFPEFAQKMEVFCTVS